MAGPRWTDLASTLRDERQLGRTGPARSSTHSRRPPLPRRAVQAGCSCRSSRGTRLPATNPHPIVGRSVRAMVSSGFTAAVSAVAYRLHARYGTSSNAAGRSCRAAVASSAATVRSRAAMTASAAVRLRAVKNVNGHAALARAGHVETGAAHRRRGSRVAIQRPRSPC